MRRTLSLALLCAAIAAGPTSASAQYFGQNKVQYKDLKYRVIQSEHFDVYFYDGERAAALDAARMAERAYARLSRLLNHQYRERQPIILFASHTEFQQNNVTDIDEGTGGVTDPYRDRMMLPFTGSYAELDHVLQHEMVHQFQFDIFARGRIGAGIQRLVAVNPPLWFMEGMAEYLSLGPVDANTGMWLRDAALEGKLPTIQQLSDDPFIFPYRFGHGLLAYIGERWGDEVIGELLHAVSTSGMESGFKRSLGMSLEQLSDEWRDAVRRQYLPQIANREMPRQLGRALLTERRSDGTLHVSPALSPDGKTIAYFSEGNSFFVDLYLADAETGHVVERLIKSAFSSNFESLRFINSAGSWSPDGKFFAIAAKHGGQDDLVIFDVANGRTERRIEVPLNGLTTPSWSPDGKRLVFTGYSGGWSDLYLVNADGTDLRRLTNDAYADLHPAWSPDGSTIAFATDRGPQTDLATLHFGPTRLALYHLDTGVTDLLGNMSGTNINPQWAPDGKSLAFVSDRTGNTNLFLYEMADGNVYQLTDIFTGISGITPLSPAISWAARADRLAFTYYENGHYDVYAVDNPRALKRSAWHPAGPAIVAAAATPAGHQDSSSSTGLAASSVASTLSSSVYRTREGFRASATMPVASALAPEPITVKALLDSATLALPDTAEFKFANYSPHLSPDYIVEPTVGYARDNFGQGIFGGTAISLSDIMGNRRLLLSGQVNGRIDEAQILMAYANLGHRTNWDVGYQQDPIFFYSGSSVNSDTSGLLNFDSQLQRFVIHQLFADVYRPLNRFQRVELGFRAVNVSRALLDYTQLVDPNSGLGTDPNLVVTGQGSTNYLQPSIAYVHDNSISLYVGPFIGRRSRFEYSPSWGDWQFHQFLADVRRYDQIAGPFILATRGLFFGRFGRDDNQFPIFLGTPDLLRGYTAGSLRDHECTTDVGGTISGCGALDQLIGSRIGVFNAELRFPLFRELDLGFLPVGFPPIEGAVFFDAGMAWQNGSEIVWSRDSLASKSIVRQPLASWGVSIRANVLGFVILRADYSKPLSRNYDTAYWTISLGPTF